MKILASLLLLAAGILRGEAPLDCPECRRVTACAIVADMDAGIHLPSRWYGYKHPEQSDIDLINWALLDGHCVRYPKCRFLGNKNDLRIWEARGWVDTAPLEYCSEKGCSICVPYSNNVLPQAVINKINKE